MTSRDDERSADGEPDFRFISEVVEAVGVGVGIYGEDGRFVVRERGVCGALGTDRETLQGRPIWEINPRFDRDRFDDYWASFVEEETRTADTVHAFDGQEAPVQTITTNRGINGTWYHFGTVQDITERHEYIARLRTLNERSRGVMSAESAEEIADIVVEITSEIIDQPITALWTYNEEEDVLIPVAAAEAAKRFAGSGDPADGLGPIRPGTTEMEIFRSGVSTLIENYQLVDNPSQPDSPLGTRLIVPPGEHGLLSLGAAAVTAVDSSDRQLIEILGRNARAAFDRVEQKRTLVEREVRLRTIVENAPLILFAVDRDRELTLQVGKGLDQVGVEQNRMVGQTVDELFGDSPAIIEAVDRSLAGEAVDVTTSVWDRTYQIWYQPIEVAGEVTSVIGVAMDITERKAHEHQIAALHEATREMIQVTDEQGVCEIAVRTAEHTLQFPITGIWLADESGDQLEPAAATNAAEELLVV